jgi:hypothetical protein
VETSSLITSTVTASNLITASTLSATAKLTAPVVETSSLITSTVTASNLITASTLSATAKLTAPVLETSSVITSTITASNLITASTLSATAKLTAPVLETSSLITSTITASKLITTSTLSATAKLTAPVVETSSLITSTITAANLITASTLSATAKLTAPVVETSSLITSTITASKLITTSTLSATAKLTASVVETSSLITSTITASKLITTSTLSATAKLTAPVLETSSINTTNVSDVSTIAAVGMRWAKTYSSSISYSYGDLLNYNDETYYIVVDRDASAALDYTFPNVADFWDPINITATRPAGTPIMSEATVANVYGVIKDNLGNIIQGYTEGSVVLLNQGQFGGQLYALRYFIYQHISYNYYAEFSYFMDDGGVPTPATFYFEVLYDDNTSILVRRDQSSIVIDGNIYTFPVSLQNSDIIRIIMGRNTITITATRSGIKYTLFSVQTVKNFNKKLRFNFNATTYQMSYLTGFKVFSAVKLVEFKTKPNAALTTMNYNGIYDSTLSYSYGNFINYNKGWYVANNRVITDSSYTIPNAGDFYDPLVYTATRNATTGITSADTISNVYGAVKDNSNNIIQGYIAGNATLYQNGKLGGYWGTFRRTFTYQHATFDYYAQFKMNGSIADGKGSELISMTVLYAGTAGGVTITTQRNQTIIEGVTYTYPITITDGDIIRLDVSKYNITATAIRLGTTYTLFSVQGTLAFKRQLYMNVFLNNYQEGWISEFKVYSKYTFENIIKPTMDLESVSASSITTSTLLVTAKLTAKSFETSSIVASTLIIGSASPATYKLELTTDSAAKPTTNTWTVTSDKRIKEDIVPADLDICYSTMKVLRLKYFKWSDNIYNEEVTRDRHNLGFIAQEVLPLFPKSVDIQPYKQFMKMSTFMISKNEYIDNYIYSTITIHDETETEDETKTITFISSIHQPVISTIISTFTSTLIIAEFNNFMSLNVDQIYKMNIGATQKLMNLVDSQAFELSTMKSQMSNMDANISTLISMIK